MFIKVKFGINNNPQIFSFIYVLKELIIQYVTEFWKITLMGVPEIIRIFEFTTILLTAQKQFKNILHFFLKFKAYLLHWNHK